MSSGTRPASLADAVQRAIAGPDPFDHAIREFLDTFYGDAQRAGRPPSGTARR